MTVQTPKVGLWIKRIIAGIGVLLLLLIVISLGTFFFDAAFGPKTAEIANLSYTDAQGTELYGYLARPEGEGPFPAVLLIHEWWGLNEGLTIMAETLATAWKVGQSGPLFSIERTLGEDQWQIEISKA